MLETPPQTDTYSTALDIFDRTHPLRVDVDENLKVTGTFTPSGTTDVNIVSSVPLPVTQSGSWIVAINNFPATQGASATVISVTVTNTSSVILAANSNRKGFIIQSTDQPVYVKLSSTAATNLYSYYLYKMGVIEKDNYTGAVSAIVSSGSTSVFVTEII